MSFLPIEIKLLPNARPPEKAYSGDAGHDLFSIEEVAVFPGATKLVSTGVFLGMPQGWFGLILSRSSWAKAGHPAVTAVIDCGFRGELKVQVHNNGGETFHVERGARIAQIVFLPVPIVDWHPVEDLTFSERGRNGFGSSG